jgi:mRNA interferase RelE/StbE
MMFVKYTVSFHKDIARLSNAKLAKLIQEAIENVKMADSPNEIKNIKNLKGYRNYYRIRIGDYRIGLFMENNLAEFSRFLHRKDIYKYFP